MTTPLPALFSRGERFSFHRPQPLFICNQSSTNIKQVIPSFSLSDPISVRPNPALPGHTTTPPPLYPAHYPRNYCPAYYYERRSECLSGGRGQLGQPKPYQPTNQLASFYSGDGAGGVGGSGGPTNNSGRCEICACLLLCMLLRNLLTEQSPLTHHHRCSRPSVFPVVFG